MRTLLALLALPFLFACPEPPLRHLNDVPVASVFVGAPDDDAPGLRLAWVMPGEQVWLDGSGSHDHARPAEELTFQWRFSATPQESQLLDVDLVEAEQWGFASFTPDVLGTYRIELVVVDRDNEPSLAAIAIVQATPPIDMTAELSWETARVDLDLHLVHPDGSYFDVDGDCFSWNPNPNWGDEMLNLDDPKLDGDADGEGAGPYRERIDLGLPTNGGYEVLVHYFLDHGAALGQDGVAAQPTITVRMGDVVLYEDLTAPAPLQEDDVWRVGLFDWPDGGFVVLNQVTQHDELAP